MKRRIEKAISITAAVCLFATLGLAGCSSNDTSSNSSSSAAEESTIELQIYAANSLSKAMDEAQGLYTEQTGIAFADTQYLGSGEINEKIGAGTYADVEITASQSTMDYAVEAGYVDQATRMNMFDNELVIVTKEDSDLQDITLADIATGKYSICLGDDAVPAGNYAAQALSTVGLYTASGVDAGKVGPEISGKSGTYTGIAPILQSSVGNVCKQAESGDVQLAIVYSSDVYRFGGVKIVGIIPEDTHRPIVYPGAVCADSDHPTEAFDFITWCVTDPDAQKIWNKWGFELAI